ncbi:hypothetical protein [Rubritalea squalenifaciens]|nr:hypothetical protein [Rubritalea squalenifaciens]
MKCGFLAFLSTVALAGCSGTRSMTYVEFSEEARGAYQRTLHQSFVAQTYYIGSEGELDYYLVETPLHSKTYGVTQASAPPMERFPLNAEKRVETKRVVFGAE